MRKFSNGSGGWKENACNKLSVLTEAASSRALRNMGAMIDLLLFRPPSLLSRGVPASCQRNPQECYLPALFLKGNIASRLESTPNSNVRSVKAGLARPRLVLR